MERALTELHIAAVTFTTQLAIIKNYDPSPLRRRRRSSATRSPRGRCAKGARGSLVPGSFAARHDLQTRSLFEHEGLTPLRSNRATSAVTAGPTGPAT